MKSGRRAWVVGQRLRWACPKEPGMVRLVRRFGRGSYELPAPGFSGVTTYFLPVEYQDVQPTVQAYATTYFAIETDVSPRLRGGQWSFDAESASRDSCRHFDLPLDRFFRDVTGRVASPLGLLGAFESYGSPVQPLGMWWPGYVEINAFARFDEKHSPKEIGLLWDGQALKPIMIMESLDTWFQLVAFAKTMELFWSIASGRRREPSPLSCLTVESETNEQVQYSASFRSVWNGTFWSSGVAIAPRPDDPPTPDALEWRTPRVDITLGKRKSALTVKKATKLLSEAFAEVMNRLLQPGKGRFESTWHVQVETKPGSKELNLVLQPQNLFAAVSVGLLSEVVGDKDSSKICENCEHKFFPKRTDQRFCKTSCRVSHSQKKRSIRGGSK